MKDKTDNMERGDDNIDADTYAAFSCIDCGQEFDWWKELEEHETKHQALLKPRE